VRNPDAPGPGRETWSSFGVLRRMAVAAYPPLALADEHWLEFDDIALRPTAPMSRSFRQSVGLGHHIDDDVDASGNGRHHEPRPDVLAGQHSIGRRFRPVARGPVSDVDRSDVETPCGRAGSVCYPPRNHAIARGTSPCWDWVRSPVSPSLPPVGDALTCCCPRTSRRGPFNVAHSLPRV
jgi:hypothetical protein